MNKRFITLTRAALLVSAIVACGFAQIRPQLPAPGWAPAGSPVARHGQLRTSGRFIVDKNNANTQLAGMSLFWSNSDQRGFYNDAAIGWLANDWNISVIRAAMGIYRGDGGGDMVGQNEGYMNDSTAQMNLIKTVIDAAIRRGIYVIVDWHSHNLENHSLNGRTQESAAIFFFQSIANQYKDYPNIIYEIYNEPLQVSWSSISGVQQRVVNAIRAIDPNNIIVVGNPNWSSQPNAGTLTGANLAYSLHFYANGSGNNTNAHQSYMNNVPTNVPTFVTEFGTTDADGGTSNTTVNTANTNAWFTFMDDPARMISWVNWSISAKDEASAALVSTASSSGGWTTNQLTTSGTLIRNRLIARTPRNPTTSTITMNAPVPAEGGTISVNPSRASYNYTDRFSITAAPNPGWELVGWTGDATGNALTYPVGGATEEVRGRHFTFGAEFYNGGLIKNGHFRNNTLEWQPVSVANNAAATLSAVNSQMRITITNAGTNQGDLHIAQTGLSLQGGMRYEISFQASAASNRTMRVRVGGPRTAAGHLEQIVDLTTTHQTFALEFNVPSTGVITNRRVDFDIGGNNAMVTVSNIRMVEKGPATSVAPGMRVTTPLKNWSVTNRAGVLRVSGPASAASQITLFDTRGRAIRSIAAKDGMTLNTAGIPSGNYLLVVRNGRDGEVFRSKVLLTK